MPVGYLVNGNNAYTYHWNDMIAYKQGDHHYITGVQYGASNTGNWRVHQTDGTTTTTAYLYAMPENDDHNNPTLAMQANHDTISFFQRHGLSSQINYKFAPEGTVSFGATKYNVDFSTTITYSQPVFSGDTIYLFTRSPSYVWAFRKSPDWAATWEEELQFVDAGSGNKIYCNFKQSDVDSDKYHVSIYGHPNESSLTDIYYCSFDITTGDISNSGGVIGNLDGTGLPLSLSSLDVAWTPTGVTNPRVRMLDVADKQGEIVISYAKWSDTDTSNPNYLYAHSADNGATWTQQYVATSGGRFAETLARQYVGGSSFDRNGRNEFYISRKESTTWRIEKWLINSDLTCTKDSTRDTSSLPLVRPVCPVGGDGVFYINFTDYTSYTVFMGKTYWRV
jgi:hypothetical protein